MAKRINNAGREIVCDRVIQLTQGGVGTFPALREGVQNEGIKNLTIRVYGNTEISNSRPAKLSAKIFYRDSGNEAQLFNNDSYYRWTAQNGKWSQIGKQFDVVIPSEAIDPTINKGIISCTMSNGEFSVSTNIAITFAKIKQYTWSDHTNYDDFMKEEHVWLDSIGTSNRAYLWTRESNDGGAHYEYYRVTGAGGLQSFRPVLYKKQTIPPTNYAGQQLYYVFSTGALVAKGPNGEAIGEPFDGWTSSIPSTEGEVYAIYSFAKGRDDVVQVADWTPPVKLSTEGTDGLAGFSQAEINLYARSKDKPNKPANNSITYKFSDGTLSSIPKPWSSTIPVMQDKGEAIWVTSSYAISRDETDILDSWTEPVIFAQNGLDGAKAYFHVKYTDSIVPPIVMKDKPAKYIGTFASYSDVASTNPDDYTWSKFVGDNGLTPVLHIAYADDDKGTGFSKTDNVGKYYLGQYADFNEVGSDRWQDYTWTRIKGEQGIQGVENITITPQFDSYTFSANSVGEISEEEFQLFSCYVEVSQGATVFTAVTTGSNLNKNQYAIESIKPSLHLTGFYHDVFEGKVRFGFSSDPSNKADIPYPTGSIEYSIVCKDKNDTQYRFSKVLTFTKAFAGKNGAYKEYRYLLTKIGDEAPTVDDSRWQKTFVSPVNDDDMSWTMEGDVIPPSKVAVNWGNIRPTSANYQWTVRTQNSVSKLELTSESLSFVMPLDENGNIVTRPELDENNKPIDMIDLFNAKGDAIGGMALSRVPIANTNPQRYKCILRVLGDAIIDGNAIIKDTLFTNLQKVQKGGAIYGGTYSADGTTHTGDGFHISSKGIIQSTSAIFEDATISENSTLLGNVNNKYLKIFNKNQAGKENYTASLGPKTGWRYLDLNNTDLFTGIGLRTVSSGSNINGNKITHIARIPSSMMGNIAQMGYLKEGSTSIFNGKFRVYYSESLKPRVYYEWEKSGESWQSGAMFPPPIEGYPDGYPNGPNDTRNHVLMEVREEHGGGMPDPGNPDRPPRPTYTLIYWDFRARETHYPVYINNKDLEREGYTEVDIIDGKLNISIGGKPMDETFNDFRYECVFNGSFNADTSYLLGDNFSNAITDMTSIHTERLTVNDIDSNNFLNFSNVVNIYLNGNLVTKGLFLAFNSTPILKCSYNTDTHVRSIDIGNYIKIENGHIIFNLASDNNTFIFTNDYWYSVFDLTFQPVSHMEGIEADTILPMHNNTNLGDESNQFYKAWIQFIYGEHRGYVNGNENSPNSTVYKVWGAVAN